MAEVGKQLQYKFSGKLQDGGTVLHTSQVAHVTFYITEQEHQYKLFSQSENRGIQQTWSEEGDDNNSPFDHSYSSYEDATKALLQEQVRLEEILEKKRTGLPTPKQLHFLFRHEIPIPIDLTWGQASDIIDECIAQGIRKRRKAQTEKFNGFAIGMRVYQYSNPVRGVWRTSKGEITKLTSNNNGSVKYAYVKWDGESYIFASRVSIDTLWKIEASEEQLRAIEAKKYFPGEKVLHPSFGRGTILYAGRVNATIQFQDGEKTLPLTELTLEQPVESV